MKTRILPINPMLLIAFLGIVFLGSCKNEGEATTQETQNEDAKSQEEAMVVKVNPAHGLPGHTCALPVGAPLNTGEGEGTTTNSVTPKVNPAHGLPGHTCALPVGAPLSSASDMQESPIKQSTTISPLRVDQTPKINPPHGEPGHLCSIPVGAPLK